MTMETDGPNHDVGLVEVTPELLRGIETSLKARFADIAERYPKLIEACPNDMRLAVTAAAIRAIVAHAQEGGTFRTLIYNRLGFGPDAYVPLYDAGGMTISNEFVMTKPTPEDTALAKRLLDIWPKGIREPILALTGGQEPWLSIADAAHRIEDLSAALQAEQEKRKRVEAELALLEKLITEGEA